VSLFREPADLPDKGKQSSLLPQEDALLDKLARKVVEKGMSVPAILFLESIKPLNFIGSQVLVFFEPMVQTLFNFKDYDTFRTSLEKRESVEILLLKIEEYDSVSMARDKRIKKYVKQHKKNWGNGTSGIWVFLRPSSISPRMSSVRRPPIKRAARPSRNNSPRRFKSRKKATTKKTAGV